MNVRFMINSKIFDVKPPYKNKKNMKIEFSINIID